MQILKGLKVVPVRVIVAIISIGEVLLQAVGMYGAVTEMRRDALAERQGTTETNGNGKKK